VSFKELIRIRDKEIKRYLKILSSHEPDIKRRKVYFGSYLIEIDLQISYKEKLTTH